MVAESLSDRPSLLYSRPWRREPNDGGSRGRRRSSRPRPGSRGCSGSCARWSPAYYFGARGPINAFTVAFQIPNLVRALVADAALSSAFVPVFSELLEKGERARAWRVASTVFWLFLLLVGGLTALFILAAPLLMPPLDRRATTT